MHRAMMRKQSSLELGMDMEGGGGRALRFHQVDLESVALCRSFCFCWVVSSFQLLEPSLKSDVQ